MQNIRVKVYAWVVDCGCGNIKSQFSSARTIGGFKTKF